MPGNDLAMKLCIFSPLQEAYSETFIHNHIKYLPFRKVVINGTEFSNLVIGGQPLNSPTYRHRIRKFISTRIIRNHPDSFTEKRLTRILKQINPDVVLFEYGHIGAKFYPFCLQLGIPYVVHFHGNDASHKPTLDQLADTYKHMFENASGIVAVSRTMIQRLMNLGAEASRILYNPYGVDLDFFRPSDEGTKEQYFLAVGRFVEKKAPHLTILAFHQVLKQYTAAKLVFIGDGPLLPVCQQLVKALSLEANVLFHGVKTPGEILTYLQNSIAFVQHSVIGEDGSAEGTPNSIIEAGAAGVPVISTRHEGINDVIEEGVNGFLVEEFDWLAMAEAMKRVIFDAQMRIGMRKKSRQIAEEKFNMIQHISLLTSFLYKAVTTKLLCETGKR